MRHNRRGDRSDNRRSDPYGRQDRQRPREDEQWSRAPQQQTVQRIIGDTVRVSNLDPRNGEEELRYIFDKIGPITRINVYFDQSGRSTGTAEVQFGTNIAAENAVKQLDQAEVDGRLMYVQLVGQIVQASTPVVQRRRDGARDDGHDGRDGGDRRRDNSRPARDGDRREGGGRGGRQQGGERRQGGGDKPARKPREEKKPVTSEDLDADMDSYRQQKSTPAEAAAPAAAE
jgi:THO complex subunit 4